MGTEGASIVVPQAGSRQRASVAGRSVRDLREARERLATGDSVRPEFEHELLAMFVRNELSAAVTMPALSVIFSLASMFWAPVNQAILWLLLVIAAKVFLLQLCQQFIATPQPEADPRVWRRRLVIAEMLNGVTWAGFALVGLGTSGEGAAILAAHVFIFATLIVVLAIRMTFASAVMPILYAGTIPMTLAVVTRLVIGYDSFFYALAAMAVGVHLYFIFLARGLNQTARAMLEFRAEKDALIAELEKEKSISEEGRIRAEAANKAKSRFLATMSHELRTPLNAIMGFSEVMRDELLGPMNNTMYRDYASDIHDSGRHLLNLINEILDLSRIEAGRYEIVEECVRLGEIVEDCHRLLKIKSDGKGLNVTIAVEQDVPPVWADQRAMRQICLNLFSNALKFTPKGGRITLTVATTDDGGQMMSVRDTGPGIPKDEIPKVMQAFGQGSLAHQTAEGGTGLGLPIVKKLVELHGGTFELHSELRKGTEALIRLPATRVLHKLPPLQTPGLESHRPVPRPTNARSPREPRLRGPSRTSGRPAAVA